MASPPRLPELEQPNTRAAIERTFAGYKAALATMSMPELVELATKQAALLEMENRLSTSTLLSAYSAQTLDSPVLPSPTMAPPSPFPTDRAGAPSPSLPPSPPRRRSGSGRTGRDLAAQLTAASRPARRLR